MESALSFRLFRKGSCWLGFVGALSACGKNTEGSFRSLQNEDRLVVIDSNVKVDSLPRGEGDAVTKSISEDAVLEAASALVNQSGGPPEFSLSEGCQNQGDLSLSRSEVAPVKLLSGEQYRNSLRHILGAVPDGLSQFDSVAGKTGFPNATEDLLVSQPLAITLLKNAEKISKSDELMMVFPCNTQNTDYKQCAESRVLELAAKAFRRPLSDLEASELRQTFQNSDIHVPGVSGIQAIAHRLFASPHFFYQQRAKPTDSQELKRIKIAHELSFAVWQEPASSELLEEFRSHDLTKAGSQKLFIAKLLQDPRARRMIKEFLLHWLEIDKAGEMAKDPILFTGFDAAVFQSLEDDLVQTAARKILAENATLVSLLTDSLDVPESDLFPIETFADSRLGLLQHPTFIASHSHSNSAAPVLMGLFLREKLMCHKIPAPPADFSEVEQSLVLPENPTLRDAYSLRKDLPQCASCHQMMEPLGLAFDQWDAVGRLQSPEYLKRITLGDTFFSVKGLSGNFADATDMIAKLVSTQEVRMCFVNKLASYVKAKRLTKEDLCAAESRVVSHQKEGVPIIDIITESLVRPTL